ncbi:hypothetical protein BK816_00555 [Boudabousia tangfeifanii]|uniref:Uncharacterized protein n=1 Tax=Boudabousia tangfeifanii TaxID=1912795 RepID=A0A1D9MI39_9ACTO|nr:prealbumin-like fold domain-containing protein [Boudabousia tangfeifanii]AOZ71967.1 hypothetical protein BK816_00555 [Boudabousia tangfeifanii]
MPNYIFDDRRTGRQAPENGDFSAEKARKRHYRHYGFAAIAATAALIGTSALTMGTAEQAGAWVNDPSIEEAVGDATTITSTLEHDFKGKEPAPGVEFNYNGSFKYEVPKGVTNTATITVTQDPEAPFTQKDPQTSDLTLTSGTVDSARKSPDDPNTWIYEVSGINADGTATFSAPAKISENAQPGDIFTASMNMTTDIKGTTGFAPISKNIENDPGTRCSGVAVYKWTVPEGNIGAWLADIKFVDPKSKNQATIDPLPASAMDLADPNLTKRNGIRITSPGGTPGDLTNQFLEGAVLRNNDSTKPLFGVDPQLTNPTFLDSINWRYNPDSWTGTQWIQPGTVFEMRRGFQYSNCLDPAIPKDLNPDRLDTMGFQVDMGRKLIPSSRGDVDTFRLPGGPVQEKNNWCDNIYVTDAGDSTTNPTNIKLINIDDPLHSPDGFSIPFESKNGGIAIARQFPQWIYFIPKIGGQANTLKRMRVPLPGSTDPEAIKIGTIENVTLSGETLVSIANQASAFDPEGNLWVVSQTRGTALPMKFTFTDKDLKLPDGSPDPEAGKAATLEKKAGIPIPSGYQLNDLAFFEDGSMLFTMGTKAGPAKTFYIPKEEVNKPRGTNPYSFNLIDTSKMKPWGTYSNIKVVYGSAFGKDGNLYSGSGDLTKGFKNLYQQPEIGNKTEVAPQVDFEPAVAKGILDLTSCQYGHPTPGPEGFKVRKSAVDPVTGTLAPAGEHTRNPVMIGADGTATLRYVVTATNVGNAEAVLADIQDTFTPPAGFKITHVGVLDLKTDKVLMNEDYSDGSNPFPITLPGGKVASGESKIYAIKIKVKAENLEAANNVAAQKCENEGPGKPGTGFFNQVALEGDKDGKDNNDSCIPFTGQPTAHLKLVKQIVDQNGRVINSQVPDDLGHFVLAATGTNPETGSPLAGANGQAKPTEGVAVDQDVVAGNYKLAELINQPEAIPGYYKSGEWTCEGGTMVDKQTVNVPKNGSATCTIKNTRIPRFHIEKLAGTPDKKLGNEHVGEAVVLKGGKGDLVYKMKVTNDSAFAGNTGEIKDFFTAPAGLVFDTDKTATVTYDGQGSRVGGKDTYTEQELKENAVLATSINNLGPQESGTFTITIPVKADTSKVEGSEVTKFEQAQAGLAVCNSETANTNGKAVKLANLTDKAALNNVALAFESPNYAEDNAVWYRDNFACIPVVENKWTVAKFSQFDPAADGADEANNGGDGYVKTPGSTGTSVTLTSAQDGSLSATVKYKVVATNAGKNASAQPAITDVITLPQGFEITSAKYGKDENALAPVSNVQGNTVTFEIPAGTEAINGGESVNYYIEVTGKISAEAAAKLNWSATDSAAKGAGECENEGAGKPGTGFFNKVSTQDDPGTDGNNDACTPVKPQLGIALVEKTDANGTRLSGAKFALYKAANSTTKPYTMGELVKAELDELTADNENRFPQDALASNDGDNKYMGRFVTPTLNAGTVYFLVETKSPTKDYSLLPEPLVFKVDGSGNIVPLNLKTGEPTGQATDGTFAVAGPKVTVHDPRAGELPKAGGNGHMPLAVGGTLLLLISTLGMTQAVRRRNKMA